MRDHHVSLYKQLLSYAFGVFWFIDCSGLYNRFNDVDILLSLNTGRSAYTVYAAFLVVPSPFDVVLRIIFRIISFSSVPSTAELLTQPLLSG